MNGYKIEINRLKIGTLHIDFSFNISSVIELNDVFIVFLDDPTVKNVKCLPKNNIYAVNKDGEVIWQINEIIKEENLYVGVGVSNNKNLRAIDFLGRIYDIDVIDKKATLVGVTK